MAALGTVERFDDEALFQIAGILSGAGPAFLFRFIDALAAGGETLGLSKDQAGRLAKAMVEGAAALAASEAESPATLADRVANPGGPPRGGPNGLDEVGERDALLGGTPEAGRG